MNPASPRPLLRLALKRRVQFLHRRQDELKAIQGENPFKHGRLSPATEMEKKLIEEIRQIKNDCDRMFANLNHSELGIKTAIYPEPITKSRLA